MEKISDIVRDIRDKWAANYFCEGCRTANGDYPEVVVIETAGLADRIEKAHGREIEKSRALVEGLLDAATIECATCDYDCSPNRENCICRLARGWLGGEETTKTASGVDRDALDLSKKLMAVLGEMIQWRGVLSEDEEDLLKALVRYTESIKEGAKK